MTRALPLTLAGSDPTGGAGIEADLKTFLAHGRSGAAVATALTTQDSRRVLAVAAEPEERFRARVEALLADLPIAGLKVGLLPDAALVRAAADAAGRIDGPVVVDPVLAPTEGAPFLDEAGRRALVEHLLPRTDLLTPNLPEAAILLGCDEADVRADPRGAAERLRALGPGAVLLKGGHGVGARVTDGLAGATPRTGAGPRVAGGARVHGTGCALAAAILCRRLDGLPLDDAIERARTWLSEQIAGARAASPSGARLLPFTPASPSPPRA
ncbi:MAG: hydroxymethylpyrimidine/phosphomethylpyrimidine kinase [Planctomycetota bacterium JB042]